MLYYSVVYVQHIGDYASVSVCSRSPGSIKAINVCIFALLLNWYQECQLYICVGILPLSKHELDNMNWRLTRSYSQESYCYTRKIRKIDGKRSLGPRNWKHSYYQNTITDSLWFFRPKFNQYRSISTVSDWFSFLTDINEY